jgi:hypothetical protein
MELGPTMTNSHAKWDIDTTKPHSARMYDYYLGGKDHFDVDKKAAEKVVETWPAAFVCAREIRSFMHRATRVLAREHGIRQWLDIGTGIPTEPNLHEIAQGLFPEARVAYTDNDPLVLKYAETLMRSTPEGRTGYIQADFNEPDSILNAPELEQVLDLSKPVALSLNGLLHFVPDDRKPYATVEYLLDALPSGSVLAMTHCTADFDPVGWERIVQIYVQSGTPFQARTKDEFRRFFDGLDLIDPGIAVAHQWHPEFGESTIPGADEELTADDGNAEPDTVEHTNAEVSLWGGVGIKP